MQKQAELYRGKAKTVYSTENPDLLVLEFRNDTSAGDGARIEQFDRCATRLPRSNVACSSGKGITRLIMV